MWPHHLSHPILASAKVPHFISNLNPISHICQTFQLTQIFKWQMRFRPLKYVKMFRWSGESEKYVLVAKENNLGKYKKLHETSKPQRLTGVPLGQLWSLRACLSSSFVPLARKIKIKRKYVLIFETPIVFFGFMLSTSEWFLSIWWPHLHNLKEPANRKEHTKVISLYHKYALSCEAKLFV